MSHGDTIAVCIDDCDLGRVLAFLSAIVEALDIGFLAALDFVGLLGCIGFGRKLLHRDVVELWVSDLGILVDGCDLHRFGDDANIFGTVVPDGGKVKILQNVEHFNQHHATAGWVVGGDAIAAIGAPKWCVFLRCAGCKISVRNQTTVRFHIRNDFLSDISGVEVFDALLGNAE